jgi:hypothetical protein
VGELLARQPATNVRNLVQNRGLATQITLAVVIPVGKTIVFVWMGRVIGGVLLNVRRETTSMWAASAVRKKQGWFT